MWIGMIESVLQKLIKRAVNSYLVSKGKSFNSVTRQIIIVIQMNCSRKTGCSQFLRSPRPSKDPSLQTTFSPTKSTKEKEDKNEKIFCMYKTHDGIQSIFKKKEFYR